MKRTWKIVIAVAIVALVINDGGRWAQATVDLQNSTREVLDSVTQNAAQSSTDVIATELGKQAAAQRIRVSEYLIVPGENVHVWTEEDVRGTWLLGAVMAMSKGVAINKAWQTPPLVHYDLAETIR